MIGRLWLRDRTHRRSIYGSNLFNIKLQPLAMSPAHHQLHHSADPAHFNCNTGASLAIWDWFAGSLRMPTIEPPGLAFGVSGHRHDPHSVMGLVIDPAIDALKALAGASAFRFTGTAAGLRTPFGGPRWPARRRYQSLIAPRRIAPRC